MIFSQCNLKLCVARVGAEKLGRRKPKLLTVSYVYTSETVLFTKQLLQSRGGPASWCLEDDLVPGGPVARADWKHSVVRVASGSTCEGVHTWSATPREPCRRGWSMGRSSPSRPRGR
jgi:hypothetical protein